MATSPSPLALAAQVPAVAQHCGNMALAWQLAVEHDPSIICRDGEVSSRQNAASFEQSWKSSPSGVSVGLRLSATHGALQPPNNLSNVVAVAAGGYFNVALK